MKTVVGAFSDVGEAKRTFEELMRFGFGQRDISVVTSLDTKARRGMNLDLLPLDASDAGKIAGCGPLADAMRHTPGLRGLSGSLRYMGLSPELAEHYVKAVRDGETLESVVVDDKDADRVVEIMSRHAARWGEEVESFREIEVKKPKAEVAPIAPAPAPIPLKKEEKREVKVNGQADTYIPVLREELRVGKREVERGNVHVSVHVTERPINEHISLREEHVEIERRPVNRAPTADELKFKDEDLEFTEHGEEAVVMKDVRVVEEVRLHKSVSEHDETINEKLRNTEIDVSQRPGRAKANGGITTMSNQKLEERRERYTGHDLDRGIPVLREELKVGKREVERGSTHLGIHTAERPVSENVRLRDEHVDVERRAVNRAPTADELAFKNQELDIVEYGEEPVVTKEVKVVEEIRVKRRIDEHDETIKDSIRTTEVKVSERDEGGFFRKHFDSLGLGKGGGNFDEHLPAYEYGKSLRGAGGAKWEDIELNARERWESKRPGTWEKMKESIKYAFSKK